VSTPFPGPIVEHYVLGPEVGEPAINVRCFRCDRGSAGVSFFTVPKHALALRSICARARPAPRRGPGRRGERVDDRTGAFPLCSVRCGARLGRSVSARMRSAGTWVAASAEVPAFGKVAWPANDTPTPRSSAVREHCGDEKSVDDDRALVVGNTASVRRRPRWWFDHDGFPSSTASSSSASKRLRLLPRIARRIVAKHSEPRSSPTATAFRMREQVRATREVFLWSAVPSVVRVMPEYREHPVRAAPELCKRPAAVLVPRSCRR